LTDFDSGLNRLPLLAPAPLGALRRHWGQKTLQPALVP